MKQVWKRTMSLALSGVLLLSNVPVQALAVEDMVEVVALEETVSVTETQSTQSVQTAVEAAGPAAAPVVSESANPAIDYPLIVNETMVTSANAPDILGNGTVTFVHSATEGNKLTLKNAEVSTVYWGAYANCGPDLTIDLPEGTQSTISGALVSEGALPGNIKITGKGRLNVGSIQVGGNLEIVDAQVLVGGDLAEGEEQKELIKVKSSIAVSGEAHVVTGSGHKAVVFTEEAGGKITGEGYGRTVKDGDFAVNVDAGGCTYFEFMAKSHLAYTANDTKHMLGCKDGCKLNKVTVLTEDHSEGQEKDQAAGCGKKAYCSKCGWEYGTEVDDHLSTKTKFIKIDDVNHKKVYACCEADAPDAEPQNHNPVCQSSGASITAVCADCGATGSVTVTVSGGVQKDTPYAATVEKKGILSNADVAVAYAGKDGISSVEAPQTYGKYTASVAIGGQSASAEYYITKVITAEDVRLDGEQLVYDGQPQTQNVARKNADSDVTFTVENNTQTDAGTYELTVTGTGAYSGSVKLPYTIEQAAHYKDATAAEQIVGDNLESLKNPSFVGFHDEEVKGSCTYLWNGQPITDIQNEIDSMEDGENAILSYEFTPAEDSNYTGPKKGSIIITKMNLTFEMEDGSELSAVLKKGDIVYGDEDIVDVSKLVAKLNGATDNADSSFLVKYAMLAGDRYDETNLLDKPNAGSAQYRVYYTPDQLGGIVLQEDVLVCNGEITVARILPTISDENKPVAEHLNQNLDDAGQPVAQPLLKEEKKGKTDDGAGLEYSLEENGEYTGEPPKVAEAGYYEVWYRSPDNGNYQGEVKGKVQVLVIPHLTATYGQTFADIKDQLPEGFAFNETAHPKETNTVGNAGNAVVILDYTHPEVKKNPELADKYPTLTGEEQKASMTVRPKKITPAVSFNEEVYGNNGRYIPYEDRAKSNVFVVKDGETKLVNKKDYTLKMVATIDGLTATHTVQCIEGGNYEFDPIPEKVNLFRPEHKVLKDNFPTEELKDTEYNTQEKAQDALSKELEEELYPASIMKYFKVYMTKQTGQKLSDDRWEEYKADDACPPNGFTYEIPYSDLAKTTQDDDFKVAVIYLTGDQTGEVVEIDSREITKGKNGLKITLEREAIVCLAREINKTEKHSITKKILLKGESSSKGVTWSIKVDDKTATSAVFGDKVTVEVKASSGYALKKVSFAAANGEPVEWTKVSEGKYEFIMRDSDVTVTAEVEKNTANGNTGDTSNIQLWVTMLAASGIAIVAVILFWLKKRKK